LSRRFSPIAVLTALALLAPGLAVPARADLFVATTVIDGPSPDILSLGDVAISRDGSGGLVYAKNVAGVSHVFASTLAGGAWSAPQQLDGGLPGAGSQPVIAAGDGGRLAVVFVSDGTLYASVRASRGTAFAAPQPLVASASRPALDMSVNGTAYASFTVTAGGVANVFAARLDRTSTSFQTFAQPLDLDPARNGGSTPTSRSSVAVATDGAALVTWAEDGADGHTHAVARRVGAQGVSVAAADLTLPSLDGRPGGDADSPQASLKDASDFGWVVFRQTFTDGAAPVSRVVARRELGSQFDPPTAIDPLGFPTADGATGGGVQTDGTGDGLAVTATTATHQTFADPVLDPDFGMAERIDGASNAIAPLPVVAVGGVDDFGAVAWQQSTGPSDPPSIHARPFDGSGFGAEAVISASPFGPVDAADGLSASADRAGDVLIAFAQGGPGARRIVVGGDAQPPRAFDLTSPTVTNKRRPVIAWRASSDIFGISGYRVLVDRRLIGVTRATRLVPRKALRPGRHNLTVVAVNRFGQTTASPTHVLRIGAKPRARRARAGRPQALSRALSLW
jgi:hypothetical protein